VRSKLATLTLFLSFGCAPDQPVPEPLPWSGVFTSLSAVPPATDTIGEPGTFGSVDAAVTLRDGGLVVLDGMNRVVRLIRDGVEVHSLGGSGDGPREFRFIRKVARFGADSLLVLDEGRRRLAILRAGPDSLEWVGDTLLQAPAGDLCVIGRRLYLAGEHDSAILHETTLEGQVVTSFGRVEGDDALSQALSGVGVLACSSGTEALAFVSLTLGVARIFSTEGSETRRDSIPGFVRTVYEVSGNAMRPRLPSEGYAHAVSSVQWVGQDLLVQLSRGRRSEGAGQDARLWRADGTWAVELPPWPRVLAIPPDTSLIATVDDPYPRVVSYRIR